MPEIKRTKDNPATGLINKVLELSQSDLWEEAVKEWDYGTYYYIDRDGSYRPCPASARQIHNLVLLINRENQNELMVCNRCATRYFNIKYGNRMESVIRRLRKDPLWGIEADILEEMVNLKLLSKLEFDQIALTKDCRSNDYFLSHRERIARRLLTYTNYNNRDILRKLESIFVWLNDHPESELNKNELVVLKILLLEGDYEFADKIESIIEKYGIDPDSYSWHQLILHSEVPQIEISSFYWAGSCYKKLRERYDKLLKINVFDESYREIGLYIYDDLQELKKEDMKDCPDNNSDSNRLRGDSYNRIIKGKQRKLPAEVLARMTEGLIDEDCTIRYVEDTDDEEIDYMNPTAEMLARMEEGLISEDVPKDVSKEKKKADFIPVNYKIRPVQPSRASLGDKTPATETSTVTDVKLPYRNENTMIKSSPATKSEELLSECNDELDISESNEPVSETEHLKRITEHLHTLQNAKPVFRKKENFKTINMLQLVKYYLSEETISLCLEYLSFLEIKLPLEMVNLEGGSSSSSNELRILKMEPIENILIDSEIDVSKIRRLNDLSEILDVRSFLNIILKAIHISSKSPIGFDKDVQVKEIEEVFSKDGQSKLGDEVIAHIMNGKADASFKIEDAVLEKPLFMQYPMSSESHSIRSGLHHKTHSELALWAHKMLTDPVAFMETESMTRFFTRYSWKRISRMSWNNELRIQDFFQLLNLEGIKYAVKLLVEKLLEDGKDITAILDELNDIFGKDHLSVQSDRGEIVMRELFD